MLAERELKIDPNELLVFNQLILELWNRRDENFGNAGEIRNIVEGLDRRRASRIIENGLSDTDVVRIDDLPMSYIHLLPTSLTEQSDVLKELDGLVGLVEVKNYLLNLINRLEYENIRTKTQSILTRRPKLNHLVFKGNPGTGKTTVARLVGKIYHSLGLLRKGHCVEVTRVDLVAGYVGQSAIKTMEKIHEALDGVLFIDEAYSLVNESGQNYGQEVIDTLVKAMENYQSRFIVIIAGYPNEIDSLLMTNPGLVSRFASHLTFEDYSSDELGKILSNSLEDNGYIYTEDVIKKAELFLEAEKQLQQKYFGNARSALTLFETIISRMAQRIVPLIKSSTNAPNDTFLNTVLVEDVPEPQTFILPQDQLNLLTARKNKARF
jgi:SpoVK/Ycf46/Vps4 family AAA+-type ATPase